jgi:uncharacterized membrane protein (UPF0127 family)
VDGGIEDGAHILLKVDGRVIADRVIYCSSSASRREGLLGLEELKPGEGLLMAMPKGRRGKKGLVTSIHMIGMRFPICVAWLDEGGKVVYSVLARAGGLYYASPEGAWYVLEAHPDLLTTLERGAVVEWEAV